MLLSAEQSDITGEITNLTNVVSPGAELHLARLVIKGKVSDVNGTRAL